MNTLSLVESPEAPGAVGPYSHALAGGGLLFTSGQIPLDARSKTIPDGIREQAQKALENLGHVLDAGGADFSRVLKTTVYLADMNDFAVVNEVYASFFSKPYPARSCFAVKDLPMGAKVEIEAIALI
ncbi:MAG: Rid family detoxifying hydrolase [Desulfovibrio sp.]|jgi:2-iminobutanoate/2-iminopropanoate deaminase|nr:Rid family detoxifying hydrolase [Desulfovibrio sp.]